MASPWQKKTLFDPIEMLKMLNANIVHFDGELSAAKREAGRRAEGVNKMLNSNVVHTSHRLSAAGGRLDVVRKRRRINGTEASTMGKELERRQERGFLDLPAEVRNIIYHIVLTGSDGSTVVGSAHIDASHVRLLQTCKTVHAEASGIFYSQKFIFFGLAALEAFLINLRPSNISSLRHVALQFFGATPRCRMPSVAGLLGDAHNLETLDPHIFSPMFPFPCQTTGMSLSEWDALLASEMAAEIYHLLWTYLHQAVPSRGIDTVMRVLGAIFDQNFMDECDRWRSNGGSVGVVLIKGRKWTAERNAAIKKAVGEEIQRLVEQDSH